MITTNKRASEAILGIAFTLEGSSRSWTWTGSILYSPHTLTALPLHKGSSVNSRAQWNITRCRLRNLRIVSEWGKYMARITDQVPNVGAVAWWGRYSNGSGSAGHVAYVEKVVSPTEITWKMEKAYAPYPSLLAATFIVPTHMYFQLKGAYGLNWFSALWRTVWLLVFCAVVVALFTLAVVVLGMG